jgi:hypothetical protein
MKVRLCTLTVSAVSLLALALGGCDGSGGGGAPQQVVKREKPNTFQEKLLALNERDRMLTLMRAVQDDAGGCPRISGSTYQQIYQNMAMWVAHCSNRDWAVYISPSGIVQVRACSEAKQLGLPECAAAPAAAARPKS